MATHYVALPLPAPVALAMLKKMKAKALSPPMKSNRKHFMADIVAMLRMGEKEGVEGWWSTMADAADEIERLRGSQAMADIGAERARHTEEEGWTPEHDDEHTAGELARAAACYALATLPYNWAMTFVREIWPFHTDWWKPITSDRRNLVKAGSMIVAEIERLDRKAVSTRQANMSKQST